MTITTLGSYNLKDAKSLSTKEVEIVQNWVSETQLDIICFQQIQKSLQKYLQKQNPNYQFINGKELSILIRQDLPLQNQKVQKLPTKHLSFGQKGKLLVQGRYERKDVQQVTLEDETLQIWNVDFSSNSDFLRKNQMEEFMFEYMLNHTKPSIVTGSCYEMLEEENLQRLDTYFNEFHLMPVYKESVVTPIYVPEDWKCEMQEYNGIPYVKRI